MDTEVQAQLEEDGVVIRDVRVVQVKDAGELTDHSVAVVATFPAASEHELAKASENHRIPMDLPWLSE